MIDELMQAEHLVGLASAEIVELLCDGCSAEQKAIAMQIARQPILSAVLAFAVCNRRRGMIAPSIN